MPRPRKKHKPRAKIAQAETRGGNDNPATLDEVMIAFQKSLARATQSAQDYADGETGFQTGQKVLYTVEGLDVELNVGLTPATTDGQDPDHVAVRFDAPDDSRSSLRFRVKPQPVDAGPEAPQAIRLVRGEPDDNGSLPIAALFVGQDDAGQPTPLAKQSLQIFITVNNKLHGPFSAKTLTATQANPDRAGTLPILIQPGDANGEARIKVGTKTHPVSNLAWGASIGIYALSQSPMALSNLLTIDLPDSA